MTSRSRTLELRISEDGTIRYCVPGCEPDGWKALEANSLIKMRGDGDSRRVDLIEPDNPRVIAWVVSVNRKCWDLGLPKAFSGFEEFEHFELDDLLFVEPEDYD